MTSTALRNSAAGYNSRLDSVKLDEAKDVPTGGNGEADPNREHKAQTFSASPTAVLGAITSSSAGQVQKPRTPGQGAARAPSLLQGHIRASTHIAVQGLVRGPTSSLAQARVPALSHAPRNTRVVGPGPIRLSTPTSNPRLPGQAPNTGPTKPRTPTPNTGSTNTRTPTPNTGPTRTPTPNTRTPTTNTGPTRTPTPNTRTPTTNTGPTRSPTPNTGPTNTRTPTPNTGPTRTPTPNTRTPTTNTGPTRTPTPNTRTPTTNTGPTRTPTPNTRTPTTNTGPTRTPTPNTRTPTTNTGPTRTPTPNTRTPTTNTGPTRTPTPNTRTPTTNTGPTRTPTPNTRTPTTNTGPTRTPTPNTRTPTTNTGPTRTPTPNTRTPTTNTGPTRSPTPNTGPTNTRTPTTNTGPTRTPTPHTGPTRTPTPNTGPAQPRTCPWRMGQEENQVGFRTLQGKLSPGAETATTKTTKTLLGQSNTNSIGRPAGGGVERRASVGGRKGPTSAGGAAAQSGCIRQILLLQLELIEQQQQQLQNKSKQIEDLRSEKETLLARMERMELRLQRGRKEGGEQCAGPELTPHCQPAARGGKTHKRRFLFQDPRSAKRRALAKSSYHKGALHQPKEESDVEHEQQEARRKRRVEEEEEEYLPRLTEDVHQYLTTTDLYLCRWHQPPPSPSTELSPSNEEAVTIPSWREHSMEPLGRAEAVDIPENLEDCVFLKRHSKHEQDEKRRKRWDIQRIREQRMFQRLQQRNKGRKGLQESQPEVLSFYPEPDDVETLVVTPYLPVVAFGRPLPKMPPSTFELPWLDEISRCRVDVAKKHTPHRTCRK